MKEKKKNRRLLFQVHIATVLCFVLAIIIIGVAVYKQNTEVFIQEKNPTGRFPPKNQNHQNRNKKKKNY